MPRLAGLHPLRISPNAGAAGSESALSSHLSSIYLTCPAIRGHGVDLGAASATAVAMSGLRGAENFDSERDQYSQTMTFGNSDEEGEEY